MGSSVGKRRTTLSLAEVAIFLQVGYTQAKKILIDARISTRSVPIKQLHELWQTRKARKLSRTR